MSKSSNSPSDYDAVMFTDGSSRGNPGRGGWGMLVVLKAGWVDEFGASAAYTTNNEMELTAILEALQYIRIKNPNMKTLILSDSSYALNGIQNWVAGWKRRGWKTATGGEVANLDIWKQIETLKQGLDITYQHIRGHAGVVGNERVDAIATAYADDVDPRLYSGALRSYGIPNILDISAATEPKKSTKPQSGTSTGAAWYISLVDGVLVRHGTWLECKDRVHGVSAKFKKVSTDIEEARTIANWKQEGFYGSS